MKKSIIFVMVWGLFLTACEKETKDVSKVVDVSFPTVTLIGPDFVHIPVGGTFTDQGATLVDDISGASSTVFATSSEVDVNAPGLYEVRYIAANANGFKGEAVRGVLVLNYTPPATLDSNFNISGDYLRAATGVIAKVIKMDNGLYIIDHVGGSTAVPAYFVTPDTTSMDVPLQVTFGGLELECINEVLITTPPITFSYNVIASGFGTGKRTFVKQ